MSLVSLFSLAADMIERLEADPETGKCQICDEHIAQGQKHKVDCEADLIVKGLRRSAK